MESHWLHSDIDFGCLSNTIHLQLPLALYRRLEWIVGSIRKRGDNMLNLTPIVDFRDAICYLHLSNIGYQSPSFTWKRGHGSNLIMERSDRGLASITWKQHFPKALLWHLLFIKYDWWWTSFDGFEEQLQTQWHKILTSSPNQEIYWQQRARTARLQSGDRNTSFFHAKATTKKQRNNFKAL